MRPSLRGTAFLVALCVVPAIICAQTTASVIGTVTDPSGAVIPGATIVISKASTGVRYEVKSDPGGSYSFASIPPGPGYSIEYSAPGFSSFKVNDVYVNVATARTQNAKMTPGGSTVEVEVTDTSDVTLNTTDASIGNNFQISKLQDLPVYDRSSPRVLFSLQPGITSSGATTGARTDQNNVTVDGLDVNDAYNGGFAIITGNAQSTQFRSSEAPPPDSLRPTAQAAAASSSSSPAAVRTTGTATSTSITAITPPQRTTGSTQTPVYRSRSWFKTSSAVPSADPSGMTSSSSSSIFWTRVSLRRQR